MVDAYGHPVTVSLSQDPERNVILWQDHRAVREAEEINSHLPPHPVLRYVGGKISPEMEPPKLLWLKQHLHEVCWKKAAHFFDLADYLTYRATGATSRYCQQLKYIVNAILLSLYIVSPPLTVQSCVMQWNSWGGWLKSFSKCLI